MADVTRRIMRTVMTNGVASRLNFAGRGRKTGIAEMKLLNAVVGELFARMYDDCLLHILNRLVN